MSEAELCPYTENERKVSKMTEYLYLHKKIPPPHNIPAELRSREKDPPTCFIPEETQCPYCPGPTPPDLLQHKTITKQATVCGYTYVRKGK